MVERFAPEDVEAHTRMEVVRATGGRGDRSLSRLYSQIAADDFPYRRMRGFGRVMGRARGNYDGSSS